MGLGVWGEGVGGVWGFGGGGGGCLEGGQQRFLPSPNFGWVSPYEVPPSGAKMFHLRGLGPFLRRKVFSHLCSLPNAVRGFEGGGFSSCGSDDS